MTRPTLHLQNTSMLAESTGRTHTLSKELNCMSQYVRMQLCFLIKGRGVSLEEVTVFLLLCCHYQFCSPPFFGLSKCILGKHWKSPDLTQQTESKQMCYIWQHSPPPSKYSVSMKLMNCFSLTDQVYSSTWHTDGHLYFIFDTSQNKSLELACVRWIK